MDWNKGRSHSRVDGVPRRRDSSKSSFLVQCTWLTLVVEAHLRSNQFKQRSSSQTGIWQTQVATVTGLPASTFPTYVFQFGVYVLEGDFFPLPFNLQVCEETSAKGIKRTHCLEATGNHGDLKVSEKEKITHRTQTLSNKLLAPRVRAGHMGLLCSLPLYPTKLSYVVTTIFCLFF